MNRKSRRIARSFGQPAFDTARTNARLAEADSALVIAVELQRAGEFAKAEAMFSKAVALNPKSATAQRALGCILMERDELDLAAVHLRRAVALKPNDTAARLSMVALLRQQGRREAAARAYEEALASDPQIGGLRHQLPNALAEPWARPIDLARASVGFLRLNPAIRAAADRSSKAWPRPLTEQELFGAIGMTAIASDRVLRFLLESCPICDIELERLLTRIRGSLLLKAEVSAVFDNDEVMAFAAALACQCFFNDYVFAASEEEARAAAQLRDRLSKAIDAGTAPPASWLSVVGCYGALHTIPDAVRLFEFSWPDVVRTMLRRQVAEPHEEAKLRNATKVLTPIDDATSLRVRAHYEESPYPHWIKPARPGTSTTLDAFVRGQFPLAPFRDLGRGANVDILIAGCGTGQQSVETAQRFAGARILAVDLSLASLGFAQRQSRSAGLAAIEYAQADIMALPTTGRSFDLIESTGVLHHLGDPWEGWQRLLSTLRPSGVMHLAFYSETARQDISAVRRVITKRGLGDSAGEIRAFRQELMSAKDGSDQRSVTSYPSFFSTSECRDLLFHRMEHCLTLPAIKAFLDANGLQFLGMQADDLMMSRFRHRFPGDPAGIGLDRWHDFEQRNPTAFGGMYEFWVQKKT
jgi:2-polyprenyl-3-methyl-5-hydroxy-6-metoxy-1,4-benzoquinol methylase